MVSVPTPWPDRKGSKNGGRGGPRNRTQALPPPQIPKRNKSWGWQARPKITPAARTSPGLGCFSCFVGTAVSRPRPQGPGPGPGRRPAELGLEPVSTPRSPLPPLRDTSCGSQAMGKQQWQHWGQPHQLSAYCVPGRTSGWSLVLQRLGL